MNFIEPGFVDSGYFVRDSDTQGQTRFDGLGKKAYLSGSAITTTAIYSRWADWVALEDNAKWPQALRTVGGDPIPGGATGLFVFAQNGWQLVTDHNITVDGILYHDDAGVSVFDILPGGGVSNKVAAIAYGVNTSGSTGPTAAEIAAAIRAEIAAELARIDRPISTRATPADIFAAI